ncbi:MAG: ATP-binding protein, partial [Anaerolineales bacterium]|nr:ATP-binding protein [Anaerolineales bacterium]
NRLSFRAKLIHPNSTRNWLSFKGSGLMNQLWVRISLTFIAIVIFLILSPSGVYLAIQVDQINIDQAAPQFHSDHSPTSIEQMEIYQRIVNIPNVEIASRLLRILLSISILGILVGIVSSRGLAAPLHNLAKAAQAVGKQDLSQRIDIKGSSEVREVAVAFNAMAAALEEADGLRNNMLADIAHELRTPLTVIQGNLRAILDDVYELDKVEVARLYDQTRQLSRLVYDLHDLALLEAKQFSLNLSSQNLIEVVQDVAGIYQPIFDDQDVNLSLDLPPVVSPVQGDCARITQCLDNLLNNALRHTAQGGTVKIEVKEQGGQVSIAVMDTGTGITTDHLPFVFDRFYRVDPDRNRRSGGSGLGLAITQALVLAHNGSIIATSEGKDLGSTFTMNFPS